METMSAAPAPALDEREIDEFFEISYKLSHLARHQLQNHLASYNLTPPQYAAMRCILAHHNRMSISALAAAVHQVTPTMTGIINRLEERGLVTRQRGTTDRRNQLVSNTPQGIQTLENITRDIRQRMGALLMELNPEERGLLITAVRSLADKFAVSISNDSKEVSFLE